jgi:hypothetical protein
VRKVVHHFGVLQKRFRRDTTPVQANSTESANSSAVVLLNNRNAQAKLSTPDRSVISARTRTNNNKIEVSFCHSENSFHFWGGLPRAEAR